MSIDDAIQKMTDLIKAACASAEIKSAKMSDEEARLSVYAPAGDMQKIKDCNLPACDRYVKCRWDGCAGFCL
jgi:hypothetical protein